MTPAQELAQTLFNATRKRLEQKVERCKACGGGGEVKGNCAYDDGFLCGNNEGGIDDCYDPSFATDDYKGCDGWTKPCPSCAKYRALLEEDYACWHEGTFFAINFINRWTCRHCKATGSKVDNNPTFSTIEEIKQAVVGCGDESGFALWHGRMCRAACYRIKVPYRVPKLFDHEASVEICMTPTHLIQAVVSWFKEVE